MFENLYNLYNIEKKIVDKCPKLMHKHSFFELVYVVEGEGMQTINGNTMRYMSNQLFLVTPDDKHRLDVSITSTFYFIKFNKSVLSNEGLSVEDIQRLNFILDNANHMPGCILKNTSDKPIVKDLICLLEKEQDNNSVFTDILIKSALQLLVMIVARNLALYHQLKVTDATEIKAVDMLQYIQYNIFFPEKIRAEVLSRKFNLSTSYIGRYFKQHLGDTMQGYINNYKLHLLKELLLHSPKRISELVDQFHFSDESHLNKFFKKRTGMSPREFRLKML